MKQPRRLLMMFLLYALICVTVTLVAFPLLWMFLNSMKLKTELYASPPTLVPHQWTLNSYRELFTLTRFPRYFLNSAIVAVSATVIPVALSAMAAYSISRFRYRAISVFAKSVLLAYMMPSVLLVIPLYSLIVRFGLANSLVGLVVTDSTFTLPFATWMLSSYFRTIPLELDEAALIDGASRWQVLWRVVFPVAIPGIVSTAMYAFTHAWNEFLYALVFISSDSLKTLPVGLSAWVADDNIFSWGMLLGGATLVTLPVMLAYVYLQRHIVAGIGAGGVKDG